MRKEAEEFDIPEFMSSNEYERRRLERFRAEQEVQRRREQEEAERRRRYKLQKEREMRRLKEAEAKKLRARNAAIVKLVIGGIVVTVIGSVLVNSLTNQASGAVEEPYEVVTEAETQDMKVEDIYDISTDTATPNIIIPEDKEVVDVDLSLEARKASIDTSGMFAVGNEVNAYLYKVLNNNKSTYELFLKYGEMYGVDPYILIAKAFQESSFNHNACLPGGKNYNGYGVGIMQHESPKGRKIVAHNYVTGEDDVIYLTMENAVDIEKNIQAAAMMYQLNLNNNYGNFLLTLQSYNYGQGMVNSILKKYAEQKGITLAEVKNDYSDTGWLSFVDDAHENANRYIDNWKGTYGDNQYIKHVLRYFIGDTTYYYYNGEKILFDLNTFEATKVDDNIRVISR